MAKNHQRPIDFTTTPESLSDHIFYGLKLDEDQKALRDAIWSKEKEIIFVDAPAGTGKTLISVATSVMLVRCGRYRNIVYVMHSVGDAQGFLPGTISEKSSVWFEPLYQALISSNENPDTVITNSSMTSQKNGMAFVTAITDSYLRGSNIGDEESPAILIIDEAQNYDTFSLRKVLTRACKGTKVIVIGHQLQCDLINPKQSGFQACMNHFKSKNDDRVAFCELHTNHRSFVAQVADEEWE